MQLRPLERSRIFRQRAPDVVASLYKRYRSDAIAAARRNNAALYFAEELQLGPQRIENGTFDTADGWQLNASWSVSSGVLSGNPAVANLVKPVVNPFEAGKTYLVQWDITAYTSGDIRFYAGSTSSTLGQTGVGTKIGVLTATANPSYFGLQSGSGGFVGSIDNVFVWEILNADMLGYQDTVAASPSYLGGSMGLLLDKSRPTPIDLIFSDTFDDAAGWSVASGWEVSGGSVRHTTTGSNVLSRALALDAGVTYIIEFAVTEQTAAGSGMSIRVGSVSLAARSGVGVYREAYTPASAVTNISWIARGATGDWIGVVDNLKIWRVNGAPMAQATAGAKPTVVRVPKKLGPELITNGAFNTADGWAMQAGWSISAGVITSVSSSTYSGFYRSDADLSLGKSYVVEFSIVASTSGSMRVRLTNGSNSIYGTYRSSVGTYSELMTCTIAPQQIKIESGASPFVGSIDNVSAREVIEWTYVLSYDGGDSLTAPSSIIGANLNQPYTMIASARAGVQGANRRLIGDSSRSLGVTSSGVFAAINHGGSGVYGTLPSGSVAQGDMLLLSADWDGVTGRLFSKGSLHASGAMTAPTAGTQSTAIGQRGNNSEFWNDIIDLVCIAPQVMPDADRKAVERFAALKMLITYGG